MMSWLTWFPRVVWLVIWFFTEQVKTTTNVVRDAFLPHHRIYPGFVRYHTRCETDVEVMLLAMLITLTPGTLTLGAEQPEGSEFWIIAVHGMYFEEPESLIEDLQATEEHMLAAIRREGFIR